jgi:Flp pilus assembly protein TadD
LDNAQEALTAYRLASKLDPDNITGWNKLGAIVFRLGNLDEAIATFNQALLLGKAQHDQKAIATTYGNLGIVYENRGDVGKALEYQQKGIGSE